MRKFLQPLAVVVILVGTGFWAQRVIATAPPPPERPPRPEQPVPVKTAAAALEDVDRTFEALGDLMPRRTSVLRSQISAQVVAVTEHPVGAELPTGEVLIEFDRRDFEVAVAEAKAGLKTAKRTLVRHQVSHEQLLEEGRILDEQWEVASADVPRKQALVEQKLLIPYQLELSQKEEMRLRRLRSAIRQQLLALEQDQEVQAATVEARQAALDRTLRELEKTRVMAPFDGHLASRSVEVGDTAAPQTELLRIEDLARLKVMVAVPSSQIGALHRGAAATVHVPDRAVTRSGTITEITPRANLRDRTFDVVVEIPNDDDPPLLAGHLARVTIQLDSRPGALVIPESALVYRGQNTAVFRLDPVTHRLEYTPVEVAEVVADRALIAAGLSAGDRVAVENLDWLYDGALWAPGGAAAEAGAATESEAETESQNGTGTEPAAAAVPQAAEAIPPQGSP